MEWEEATKLRLFQMNEMDELRFHAYESARLYKVKMKYYHDMKILKGDFQKGDSVLLYNSTLNLFSGMLKSRWSGPFELVSVSPNGSMELKTMDGTWTFPVNGHRMKHCHWCIDGDRIVDRHRLKHRYKPDPE
ncbi:uncharacterized protein LOC132630866 [Lycium barbarum]|uniref:uncharacterized protein LOC132630866 n=1 Tax=Lycium barbarum TaxID=112863 RepID=UPI00293E5E13|nr:uncharacterized protein LOC132630866 [Lycium barbarum]